MVDRTLASALRSIRDRLTRLERRLGGTGGLPQVWRRRGTKNARLAILPFGNEGLEFYQTDQADAGEWIVDGGAWVQLASHSWTIPDNPIVGEAWDGKSRLRIHILRRALSLTNGRGSLPIGGFPRGILFASITMTAGASMSVVRPTNSTVDELVIEFWSSSGNSATSTSVSALVVTWGKRQGFG